MSLETGQVLQNRYRVVKLLAQGGFGSVYRAWDINLSMPVALKESLDTSAHATRQFSQEAKLLSNLSHPNLPRVMDFFTIPDQGLYLVMEFVQGQDLEEKLETTQEPIPESQVLPWILQVCDALIYLHSCTPPTIHRDIKPANIRITPEGQAYLVDFGIAKQYDPGARTLTGARAVTPGYAPFEQYGQRITDARTDIYGLGATLYHLLSGQKPPESIGRMAGDRLVPLRQFNPNIHPGIEAAILRAMQLMPEQRYQSMTEFKKALLNPLEPALQVAVPQQLPVPATVRSVAPTPEYAISAIDRPVERKAVRSGAQTRRDHSKIWMASLAVGVILLIFVIGVGVIYLTGDQNDLLGLIISPTQTQKEILLQPSMTATYTPRVSRPSVTPVPTSTVTPGVTPVYTESVLPEPTMVPTLDLSPTPELPEGLMKDAQGILMTYIPGGSFWMGNNTDAWQSRPMRGVEIDAYYIDVYEITNAAYARCVSAGVCTAPLRSKSSTRQAYYGEAIYDNFPVVQVNWAMAQQYCQWRGSDLPNEAQWEKAARGTDQRTFPWEDDNKIDCSLANYKNCKEQDTDAVDKRPGGKSPYGIFDMAGNVREWVADWYAQEYYRTAPSINPLGPVSGTYRVVRGGSWQDTSNFLRVYYRLQEDPSVFSYWIGFRCARTLP